MPDIKNLYHDHFLPQRSEEWHRSYVQAVQVVRNADEETFRNRDFQRMLWELEDVSSIGPGKSVAVPGAYGDNEIVDALWALKTWPRPSDVRTRARELDEKFNSILHLVSPRHNARRPSARLVRIFAAIRPEDVLCLMDGRRSAVVRQWLGAASQGLGLIGQHVISRDALRSALGDEKSVDDLVSYSQFSWYAWELIQSELEEGTTGGAENLPSETKATDRPKLTILPARVQRKGMFYVSDNLQILLSLTRAAENGIERGDLLQQIGDEAPGLNQGSRGNIIAQAVSLGILAVENGTYRPTSVGRGLLEHASPADLLTPAFVRSVFGFALILSDLSDARTLTREQIGKRAQEYYPRWTTTFAPNSLIAWLRELGLASIKGAGRSAAVSITEDGEYWASGLPVTLREPLHILSDAAPPSTEDLEDSVGAAPLIRTALQAPTIEAVLSRFRASPELQGFVFSDEQVRLIHAALHSSETKRFILLSGLSGTGKTYMARAYARAYCEALELSPETYFRTVAVWPDWTDPTGLLGYVNPLASPPVFHETPALRFVLEASRNAGRPYFLCLDEMNLARVEHYFAPFLSAMEPANGRLSIHAADHVVDAVPAQIPWPSNLFVIGTVNMDETTYPFSDKVLDRAFTFEFWDADLSEWRDRASKQTAPAIVNRVYEVLSRLYGNLFPARRHFGYRTCDEVLGFCSAAGGASEAYILDAAILAKVLPKVRGDAGGALPQALADAEATCVEYALVNSARKLAQMSATLRELGAVRFWS